MHDLLIQVIFYAFAGLAVLSALLVITQNNPVRCVLFLVVTFFASSVLWIMAQAEFLALILLLVYVGAVMTLFLFVVMMLNIDIESMRSHFVRYLPFGLIVVALLGGLFMVAIPQGFFKTSVIQSPQLESATVAEFSNSTVQQSDALIHQSLSNTESLGMVIYTHYVYAFELAAVILLVAIIAAIALTHRSLTRSKKQNVVEQIMTNRNDRVTLISMKSEQ